jgi:hypothetical protein
MWSSKSAARTFFARLFENKKKSAKHQQPSKDDDDDMAESAAALHGRRKRSHSLFAPNMNALLSGQHIGGLHHHQSLLAGTGQSQ